MRVRILVYESLPRIKSRESDPDEPAEESIVEPDPEKAYE
jgi:hypothetical protein